jgi:arabinose-5-phosphate isomerase
MPTMTDAEMIARAKEVFDIEIAGLQKTRDSLGTSFTTTIAMMVKCLERGGKIVVSGVGKNLHIAEKMSAIFASTGTCSIVLNPVQAMHGDLGMVGERDLLLALSFSGESEEVIKLIPAVRRHGLEVVALVGNADSTLAKLSDVTLEIPCGKEACPFGMAPTNSTTATMAMGDALAMVMIDAIAFNKESYALNHPAGAIGRALVMKATDIMRSGARLAKVSSGATVMETLMAMTAAKSGSVTIVDGNDGLLGIFTDGDFRRVVSEKGETSLNDAITSYMTAKPLFVKTSQYASELLRVFEKRQIDDLPVCDENGRVVGMIDIQDLPKMKVL